MFDMKRKKVMSDLLIYLQTDYFIIVRTDGFYIWHKNKKTKNKK